MSWSSEVEIIHGLQPGSFEGTLEAVRRPVHPADLHRLTGAIEAALAAPNVEYRIEYRILRPDGTLRWLGATGRVIVDIDGRPVRMLGVCLDITARKRSEDATAFVADASRVMATTLAPNAIVQQLARFVVPRVADWCIVQVTEPNGWLAPVEVVYKDAELAAWMRAFIQRTPSPRDLAISAASVAGSGRAVLIPRITDDLLVVRAGGDADALRVMRGLRLGSMMTVPLQARGRMDPAAPTASNLRKRQA